MSGDASELGDVGESPGKSSLFLLTAFILSDHGSGLSGDMVVMLAEHPAFWGVRSAFDDP